MQYTNAILFTLWLSLTYFSVGQLLRNITPQYLDKNYFFRSSTLGLTIISIITCSAYYLDIRAHYIFILVNTLSIFGLCLFFLEQNYLVFIKTRLTLSLSFNNISFYNLSISVLSLCILTLPGFIGSTQFDFFRGNHYDAYNYLEMASTYAHFTHHQVLSLSTEALTSQHGFYTASFYIHDRPLVSILYAVFQYFNPVYFTQLHYYFHIYSLFLTGGLLATFLQRITPSLNKSLSYLISFGFVIGFWGQYILDLDAWSQIVWTPVELLLIYTWIEYSFKIKCSTESQSTDIKFICFFTILCVASFCLYNEGFLFFGVPLFLVTAFSFNRVSATSYIKSIVLIIICTFVISSFFIDLSYVFNRINSASSHQSTSPVEWWRYYDSYIFGNRGVFAPNIFTLINEISSGLGFYFITPGNITSTKLSVILEILLGCGIIIIFFSVYLKFKSSNISSFYRIAFVITAAGLTQCAILVYNHQYWGAGKCISYIAVFVYLILTSSLLVSINIKLLSRTLLTVTLILFISTQIYFSIYRIYRVSTQSSGIHYNSPYPAIQDAGLMKKIFSFNDLTFLDVIKPTDEVGLFIEDPWIEHYIQMVLISHSIPYHLELPICEQPKFNERKGNVAIIKPTTLRLHLSLDKTRLFPYFIKADPI